MHKLDKQLIELRTTNRVNNKKKLTNKQTIAQLTTYIFNQHITTQLTPNHTLTRRPPTSEGHEHWTVATSSHHETQLFTARFETSTEPEEETLYRNLVKVVLPKIDIVVAEQVCVCVCVCL